MAIEREQLSVSINVDSKKAQQNLKNVKDKVDELKMSFEGIKIDNFIKEMNRINESDFLKKMNLQIKQLNENLTDQVAPINQVKKEFVALNRELDKLGKNQKSINTEINSFSNKGDSFNEMNNSLKAASMSQKMLVESTQRLESELRRQRQEIQGSSFSLEDYAVRGELAANSLDRLVGALAFSTLSFGAFKAATDSKIVESLATAKVGAIKLADVFKGTFSLSVLSAVEIAGLAAPAIALLGREMEKSENGFISASGTILKFAGIALVSLSAAISLVLVKVGEFIQGIGFDLARNLAVAEQRFKKLEVTMSQFNFVISNFNKELGENTVGSLEMWNKQLDMLVKNSTFSRDSIAKSIKLIVAEGSILGLSVKQNVKLLELSADVAAATGNKIEDVSQRVLTAISQNASAVLGLGIDIRNHNIEHSKFIEQTGLSIDQLTKEEQVQLRLNEVFEKSIPLMGAATEATRTFLGAEQQLKNAAEELSSIYGQQNQATKSLILFQTDLIRSLLDLPKPLIEFVGTMQDLLSATLIVIGSLIKWTVTIFAAVLAIKAINAVLVTYLGLTISISSALKTLLLRFLPITLAVIAVKKSFDELNMNSTAFASSLSLLSRTFSIAEKGAEGLKNESISLSQVISNVFEKASNIIKSSIIGWVQLFLLAQRAYLKLKKLFADDEDLNKFQDAISANENALSSLSREGEKTLDSISSLFESSANASVSINTMSKEMSEADKISSGFRKRVLELADSIGKNFDIQNERIKIFGNEFQKASAKIALAENEIQNVFKGKSNAEETANKLAEGRKKLTIEQLNLEKLVLNTIKEVSDLNNQIVIQNMQASGQEIAAIKLEKKLKLESLEAQKNSILESSNLNRAQIAVFEKQKQLIEKSAKIRIESIKKAAEIENDNKRKDALEKNLDLFVKINMENERLSNNIKLNGLNQVEAIKTRLDLNLKAIDQEIDRIRKESAGNQKAIDALKQQKTLLSQIAQQDVFDSQAKALDNIVSKNKSLENQIRTIGLEGQDLAKEQLAIAMDQISLEEERLKANGLLNDQAIAGLQRQRDLIAEISQKSTTKKSGGGEEKSVLGDAIASVGDISGQVFGGLMNSFNSLMDMSEQGFAFQLLEDLPQRMADVIDRLPEMFAKFTETFFQTFDTFLDKLPGLVSKIIEQIPAIIDKVFAAATKILDVLPQITQQIFESLPGLISQILDNLPALIEKIFEVLPEIVTQLIRAIPRIITNILDRLPMIVEKVISGMIGALGEITAALIDEFITKGGIVKIAIAFVKAVVKSIGAIVKGFVDGVARAFKALFSGIEFPGSAVKDFGKQVETVFKKVVKSASGVASEVFGFFDIAAKGKRGSDIPEEAITAINVAVTSAGDRVSGVLEKFLGALSNLFDRLFDLIIEAFDLVWEKVLKPFIDLLSKAWMWVKENIIDKITGVVMTAFQWVVDNILNPLAMIVMKAFNWVVENILEPMGDFVVKAFTFVIDFFSKTLPTLVKDLFNGVVNSFKSLWDDVGKIFNNIFVVFRDIFENKAFKVLNDFINAAKSIFAGGLFQDIKTAFENLGSAFNNIAQPFKDLAGALKNFNPANIFSGGGGDKGPVTGIPGSPFNSGGLVPGYNRGGFVSGGGSDSVPALLTPGEFVFSRNSVNAIGAGTLSNMNETGKSAGTSVNNSNVVNIEPGAIVISGGGDANEMADMVVERIKELSLQGRFVVAAEGIRVS